jgi:putative transposon-encoded protein
MDKPQIICHAEKSTSLSLFDCRWIPCSAKFVVLGSKPKGTGVISVYEISDGDVQLVKEVHFKFVKRITLFRKSTMFAVPRM